MRHRPPVPRHAIALVAAVLAGGGCRAGADAFAPMPRDARVIADQAFASVHYRFTNPEREGRYEAGRLAIARAALAPRSLLRDTLWTARRPAGAALIARGHLVDQRRYAFDAAPAVPLPTAIGDSRHLVALDSLGGDDFRWTTQVDQALGAVTPRAIGAVFTALLASAERPAAALRRDYRATAPRTTAVLGQLFTLDSISTRADDEGATTVRLRIAIHADSLRASYPAFAEYLRKYVSPARYRIALRDRAAPVGGVAASAADTWFLAEADDDTLVLTWRSRAGELVPLDGPIRPRPDTLTFAMDAWAKISLFTIGAEGLRGEFVFAGDDDEVGWEIRFRDEPRWDLPPIVGRLIRTPLRRPFEGDGTFFSLTVQRGPSGGGMLHRRLDFAVRESAIMRWLGRLGFTALDDFAGRVERDEARFIAAAMAAMRADLRALSP